MQVTQSYHVGGITAVGRQAEKLLGLRTWAAGLDDREKEALPEQIQQLTAIYVHLMDSLIMLVRAMGDMTNFRRRMFRNDLVEPYKSLMEDDKNPPTPDWLAGEDVPGAIRKAKANAGIADDIARRGKWPKKTYNRNSRNYNARPYNNNSGKKRNQNYMPRRDEHQDSYNHAQNSSRGRGRHKNSGDRRGQDFWRRDS